jgi:hypothetical protein
MVSCPTTSVRISAHRITECRQLLDEFDDPLTTKQ